MHKKRMAKSSFRVKIPTAARLANIAAYYLQRFAASEDSLRRVLDNRIRRAAYRDAAFGQDHARQSQLRLDIETIIDRHRKTGVLNDAAYAESKTHSLRRAGKSRRMIEQKLKLKGIAKSLIEKALAPADDNGDAENDEMKAAIALAKKRKLGPYRLTATDDARHKKDIGVMARAGFSLSLIRKVLGGDVDDLDEF